VSGVERRRIALVVNGERLVLELPPLARLLDVLRDELRLVGTKEGCGEGECGACTVLVDGDAVNACILPVCQVDGAEVRTIEGPGLEALGACFLEENGTQCGICTPGLMMMARAFLDECGRRSEQPTRADVRRALAGNLCRCRAAPRCFAGSGPRSRMRTGR
jgi:carbon-monoxide dehydrogenase small subunit